MKKISILVVDDHKLIRDSLISILENDAGYEVVGTSSTAEEGIELARELAPDILVCDINMPGMNGIDAVALMRKASPRTRILGMSLHTQPAYAKKMIRMGAMGYVTKNSPLEELFHAFREIIRGNRYICVEIRNALAHQLIEGDAEGAQLNALSEREIEIIEAIRNGQSSKEIAAQLYISYKTVEVHRYNILKKLNLKNTAALINFINRNYLELGR